MVDDKRTIGIATNNLEVLQNLVTSGYFASEIDAAKFAMSVAIKNQCSLGATEGAPTKWNIGSIDPNGTLSSLIQIFFPQCDEPYRLVEYLMNEGLKSLKSDSVLDLDVHKLLFSSDA
jgi:hypothetical protein